MFHGNTFSIKYANTDRNFRQELFRAAEPQDLGYKTGKSVTKRESRLQNRNLIYKTGLLGYKRDSQLAIHSTNRVT